MQLQIERLERLANLLETYKFGQMIFDMGCWGEVVVKHQLLIGPKYECGTAACAVGLACLSPEFEINYKVFKSYQDSDLKRFEPEYLGATGWEAVQAYFGLDGAEVVHLFHSDSYDYDDIHPVDVASRIRKFCHARKWRIEYELPIYHNQLRDLRSVSNTDEHEASHEEAKEPEPV